MRDVTLTETTLYFAPHTCARVALTALEQAEASYVFSTVAFMAGDHRKPEFLAVNPKGKVPALAIDGLYLTENVAILDYLARWHGSGNFAVRPDAAEWPEYLHWMHYAEGSAMLPLMLQLYTMRLGEAGAPLQPRIDSEIANHLGYIEASLKGREYLVGKTFTAADVQISFVLEVARAFGKLAQYPAASAYLDRMHARPAYKRGIERGGPYSMGV